MKKIAIVLYGNIRYDGRVQKEIKTFLKNNYDVTLYCSDFDEDDNMSNYPFKIKIIKNTFKERNSLISFFNLFLFNLNIYKILKKEKVDYIHCNDLNTIILGFLYSKIAKVIFDAHELFPESQENKLKQKIWNFIEKKNIKYMYKIIEAEINRKKYLEKKYNLNKDKVVLIENFPLKRKISDIKINYFAEKYQIKTQKKIALYIGAIMKKRNILEIIKTFLVEDDLIFICIGKFKEEEYKRTLIEFVRNNNLEKKVLFKENIPQEEVLDATNSADLTFIFYQNVNLNNYYCASNKLYEALNCGVKIITNDYPGIIVTTQNISNVFRVKDINPTEIKKGLDYLLSVKKVEKTEFYWENQEKKFLDIYS